jgi:hypothetical protein
MNHGNRLDPLAFLRQQDSMQRCHSRFVQDSNALKGELFLLSSGGVRTAAAPRLSIAIASFTATIR